MDPVAYPVLADNLFPRDEVTGAAAEPFSTTVTLPNETCENCTLQVIQFMSEHAPGYFYHHCANLRIVAADAELPTDGDGATGAAGSANVGAGSGGNAGAGGSGAASSTPPASGSSVDDADDADDDEGCSLSPGQAQSSRAFSTGLGLIGIAMLWRRRQRR